MKDFFEGLGILIMVVFWMLICVVAVPIGLLLSLVWAPAEGVLNFCRGVCRLRDWK